MPAVVGRKRAREVGPLAGGALAAGAYRLVAGKPKPE